MGYKYREVRCPYCDHKFMWEKSVQDGCQWTEYTHKVTKETCLSAKCPAYSEKKIVSEDFVLGIKIDSEDYIESVCRGI